MVKSTPISNITNKPEIEPTDIEQLVDEKVYQQPTLPPASSPVDLQAQIDLLKLQLQASAAPPTQAPTTAPPIVVNNIPPPPTHQFSQVTNDIINKTTVLNVMNTFDFKLFGIVVVAYLLLNSNYVSEFLTSKLDVRNLNYLKPFIISSLMAVAVVITNNI